MAFLNILSICLHFAPHTISVMSQLLQNMHIMVVLDDVPVDITVQEVAQWAAAWTAATDNTKKCS